MARYGLAIDLSRCTGCYACMIACKSENSTLPGVLWIRIEEKEEGEFPKVSKTWIPMLCMQCAEMPCAQVCPTGAITRGGGRSGKVRPLPSQSHRGHATLLRPGLPFKSHALWRSG